MSAPDLDVNYIADLARLRLTEEETAKFQAQLEQVLEHVEQLKKLDVEGVEPMAHATPVFNVFREDGARPGLGPDEALRNAPRAGNGLFLVTKVVE
jgi:aspartyl-tRNA(Asn)/glutamyl-tRNA(Gln) amidotransferase subunit C